VLIISVLPRQDLVAELCRNVKSHMLELRYEVLPRKHQYVVLGQTSTHFLVTTGSLSSLQHFVSFPGHKHNNVSFPRISPCVICNSMRLSPHNKLILRDSSWVLNVKLIKKINCVLTLYYIKIISGTPVTRI
jgi:hypothetical protein